MVRCPTCCYVVGEVEGECVYCPHCHTIFKGGTSLSEDGRGVFRFSDQGDYGYVVRRAHREDPVVPDGLPSLQEQFHRVAARIGGLLIWLLLVLLLPGEGYFWIRMPIAAALLLLLGCHWSNLMMHGIWKPTLFPAPVEQIRRLAARGRLDKAAKVAYRKHLDRHPGVLATLGKRYLERGEEKRGKELVEEAFALCPTHPYLVHLHSCISKDPLVK